VSILDFYFSFELSALSYYYYCLSLGESRFVLTETILSNFNSAVTEGLNVFNNLSHCSNLSDILMDVKSNSSLIELRFESWRLSSSFRFNLRFLLVKGSVVLFILLEFDPISYYSLYLTSEPFSSLDLSVYLFEVLTFLFLSEFLFL